MYSSISATASSRVGPCAGKMLSLVSVRSDKVPNVLLLLEMMEKLGVGAGSAPSVDPLARVRI